MVDAEKQYVKVDRRAAKRLMMQTVDEQAGFASDRAKLIGRRKGGKRRRSLMIEQVSNQKLRPLLRRLRASEVGLATGAGDGRVVKKVCRQSYIWTKRSAKARRRVDAFERWRERL